MKPLVAQQRCSFGKQWDKGVGAKEILHFPVSLLSFSPLLSAAASVLSFLMLATLSLLFSPGPHLAQRSPFKAHQRVVPCSLSKLTLMTPPHELVSQLFLLVFPFGLSLEACTILVFHQGCPSSLFLSPAVGTGTCPSSY